MTIHLKIIVQNILFSLFVMNILMFTILNDLNQFSTILMNWNYKFLIKDFFLFKSFSIRKKEDTQYSFFFIENYYIINFNSWIYVFSVQLWNSRYVNTSFWAEFINNLILSRSLAWKTFKILISEFICAHI
jgi:hypothetical protein